MEEVEDREDAEGDELSQCEGDLLASFLLVSIILLLTVVAVPLSMLPVVTVPILCLVCLALSYLLQMAKRVVNMSFLTEMGRDRSFSGASKIALLT